MPKNKVNSPVFVYNDSHVSLNHQYTAQDMVVLSTNKMNNFFVFQ